MWSIATTQARYSQWNKNDLNRYEILSGCYEKSINYSYPDGEGRVPIPMSQIESLIQLSEYCEQDIQYDCTLAPLTVEGVDMAFWEDRTGETNNYFTGEHNAVDMVTVMLSILQGAPTASTYATATTRLGAAWRRRPATTPATATPTSRPSSPTPAPSPTPPPSPWSSSSSAA